VRTVDALLRALERRRAQLGAAATGLELIAS